MKSSRVVFCIAAIAWGSTMQHASSEARYEPDHLVLVGNVSEGWEIRYDKALRPQLKLDATFFARVVFRPSFSGESCLRLHGNDGESDISKARKFFLTCYEADKSIWYSLPENSNDGKKGEVKVAVWSAPVSGAFAKRMRAIWDQMLARTQPPDKPNTGLDGETFEFATPGHSGQTWSPMQRKSPALFVELCRSLADYCKAAPERRERLMEGVGQHAKVLEDYLKEHPVK